MSRARQDAPFPIFKPLHFRAGLAEELHLHLLELTHTEHKLAGHNLVAEGLAYLCDAEGQLHAARLLHIEIVHKDALGGLRTQVYLVGGIGERAHLGGEHQVELAHVSPVFGSGDGIHNALIEDNLLQGLEIRALHGLRVAGVEFVALLGILQNARIRLAELLLVESLPEAFAGLGHLLFYLLFVFSYLVFYQIVGTIAFL